MRKLIEAELTVALRVLTDLRGAVQPALVDAHVELRAVSLPHPEHQRAHLGLPRHLPAPRLNPGLREQRLPGTAHSVTTTFPFACPVSWYAIAARRSSNG